MRGGRNPYQQEGRLPNGSRPSSACRKSLFDRLDSSLYFSARGRVTVNVEPLPTSLSSLTVPP